MTGIVVSEFKNELYIFADGRVTQDDFVLTDKDNKVVRYGDHDMFSMCGDSNIIEPVIELCMANTINYKTLKDIPGEGYVIWVTNYKLALVEITEKTDDKLERSGISWYPLDSLPMFFGSGAHALGAAYNALNCSKCKTKKSYVNKVRKAFSAACKKIVSMGELNQIETIRRIKE